MEIAPSDTMRLADAQVGSRQPSDQPPSGQSRSAGHSRPAGPSGQSTSSAQARTARPVWLTRTTRSVGLSLGRLGLSLSSETVSLAPGLLSAETAARAYAQAQAAGAGLRRDSDRSRDAGLPPAQRRALLAYAQAARPEVPESLGLALVV